MLWHIIYPSDNDFHYVYNESELIGITLRWMYKYGRMCMFGPFPRSPFSKRPGECRRDCIAFSEFEYILRSNWGKFFVFFIVRRYLQAFLICNEMRL